MSSDNEKKPQFPQFGGVPQFPNGAYPYAQGNVQFQPVYYQPVSYDVATSVNAEDQQTLLGNEGEKKCFISRMCKRWRGRKCNKTVHDDGRSLGNLNNFIAGLLFGTISPFFSLVCVYGFESKKLTRTGTLFGHANFFLLLAFTLLAFGKAPHAYPHGGQQGQHPLQPILPFYNFTATSESAYLPPDYPTETAETAETNENTAETASDLPAGTEDATLLIHKGDSDSSNSGEHGKHDDDERKHGDKKHGEHGKHGERHGRRKACKKMLKAAVGASLVAGLIFMVISMKSFKRFMVIYRTRENKAEADTVKAVSEAGNCRGFFFGMLASVLWPMVGTALVILIRRKNLTSRYGAIHGLGIVMVIGGIIGAFHGVPPVLLFKGLLLCQISSVHFKRAIASANATPKKIEC